VTSSFRCCRRWCFHGDRPHFLAASLPELAIGWSVWTAVPRESRRAEFQRVRELEYVMAQRGLRCVEHRELMFRVVNPSEQRLVGAIIVQSHWMGRASAIPVRGGTEFLGLTRIRTVTQAGARLSDRTVYILESSLPCDSCPGPRHLVTVAGNQSSSETAQRCPATQESENR